MGIQGPFYVGIRRITLIRIFPPKAVKPAIVNQIFIEDSIPQYLTLHPKPKEIFNILRIKQKSQ